MEASLLSAEDLLLAYAQGCFPMPDFQDESIIRWYRPDPRAIIPLEEVHVSRSMRRHLNRKDLSVRINSAFKNVMMNCARRPETWITKDIIRAYTELHALGFAHSLEIFRNDSLLGGIYGVSLGSAFFAESMFHSESNMSKLALIKLMEHLRTQGFTLFECQFLTGHLQSMGAREISDSEFMSMLAKALNHVVSFT